MPLKMERTSHVTDTVASIVFHTFVILGQLGTVYTAVRGITRSTIAAAFLLFLAGLMTLVYPHVGTNTRFVVCVWGKSRRSGMPWLAMLALLIITAVYAGSGQR